MMRMRVRFERLSLWAFILCAAMMVHGESPAAAAGMRTRPMTWTTLGTNGGPVVNASRSQPANLLVAGKRVWLVDCGDGAVERLAAAGYWPTKVNALFISHLHMDHIGGVQGLIGLRWMLHARGVLTIYGPPGTDTLVAGILQSMQPSAEIGLAIHGEQADELKPANTVRVVILRSGSDIRVDGVRVRAVRNTHFDDPPGHSQVTTTESLSYRFDLDGYSIGYTGDTGVSQPVTRLFKDVDLLVSEVIDLPDVIHQLQGPRTPVPPQLLPALIQHLKTQHLTPQEAGAMAAADGAHRLVFTHLSIVGPTRVVARKVIAEAHETFHGSVEVAHDLESF